MIYTASIINWNGGAHCAASLLAYAADSRRLAEVAAANHQPRLARDLLLDAAAAETFAAFRKSEPAMYTRSDGARYPVEIIELPGGEG